jgi:Ca2+/H+ antiporter
VENGPCKQQEMISGIINGNIMKWYFYLNFFIYRHYKKNENSPVISALIAISLLLHLNIFTISTIYHFATNFWTTPQLHQNYIIIIIAFLCFLAVLNYVLIYHKKKYVKIFEEFKKDSDNYKHWDISSKLYIILSIALCLITLIIADLRNHNFELYFLK